MKSSEAICLSGISRVDEGETQASEAELRVELAAKMLVIAWTMMKNNTAFDSSTF